MTSLIDLKCMERSEDCSKLDKLYPPVCSTMPASLQAQSQGIAIRAKKVDQKGGGGDFSVLGKNKKIIPASQSRYTIMFLK